MPRPRVGDNGLDAALCLLSQHPATWKLYSGCNIFVKEKRVPLTKVRYWDRKQRCA